MLELSPRNFFIGDYSTVITNPRRFRHPLAVMLGRDDLSGFFTYLIANALLYGVVFAALVMTLTRRRWESRR